MRQIARAGVHILRRSKLVLICRAIFSSNLRIHFGNYILNFGIKLFLLQEDNVYMHWCYVK